MNGKLLKKTPSIQSNTFKEIEEDGKPYLLDFELEYQALGVELEAVPKTLKGTRYYVQTILAQKTIMFKFLKEMQERYGELKVLRLKVCVPQDINDFQGLEGKYKTWLAKQKKKEKKNLQPFFNDKD